MTPDIADKLAAIGRVIDPAKTGAIYAPLHDTEPYAGVAVTRDISYGPAERHLLDVFLAEDASGPRPVLVFVHGGGFTGGNKATPGSPFYDNVPLWAARNGLVGVNMTYRLAPQASVAGRAGGCRRRAALGRPTIFRRYGGDPSKIVLFGHSAGATHAGTYAAMPQFQRAERPRHRRADSDLRHLRSDRFSGERRLPILYRQRRFALCRALADRRTEHTRRCPRWWSMPNSIRRLSFRNSRRLVAAMAEAPGGKPITLMLRQHSHLSLGYAIGTDDTALTGPVLDFVRGLP